MFAPKAQQPVKQRRSMESVDARDDNLRQSVRASPRSQHNALLSPPLTIDQTEPDHVDHIDALDAGDTRNAFGDLESSDHLKVRAALAALAKMGPKTLLNQIDKPERPKWQTVIEDWFPVNVPRRIFDEWNAQRTDWDHLHFEYDRATETMIIKCMPSKMHEKVPARFVEQAAISKSQLSQKAKVAVETGSTESAFSDPSFTA